jgi:hypothetical protein
MNATELTTLSMSELKAICTSQSIEVVGDKRSKSTYINSIEKFQCQQQTVIETEVEAAETDLPAIPTPKHGSAIVILAPLILLSVAIISVRIGIGALISLIAAVGRSLVAVWGSTICPQPVIPTIDRFPLPAVIPISA